MKCTRLAPGLLQVLFNLQQGRRPQVPPRGALPGSDTLAFEGLEGYCKLMRDCWAQQPAERPTFETIIPRLGGLLEGLASSTFAGPPLQRSITGRLDSDGGPLPSKKWGSAPIQL